DVYKRQAEYRAGDADRDMTTLKSIVEALLFVADRPLTPAEIRAVLAKAAEQTPDPNVRAYRRVKIDEIESALSDLAGEIGSAGRSYQLVCVAGAWQIVVGPEFAPWVKAFVGERERPGRLSLPALETLAIIAYRQPVTRAEIEDIRGVSVDGVIQTLLERGLIEPAGKADAPGRPTTYVTTKAFLEHFGLPDLDHLPDAGELKRVAVERPPGLVTAESGLATVPPDQLTAVDVVQPVNDEKPEKPSSRKADGSLVSGTALAGSGNSGPDAEEPARRTGAGDATGLGASRAEWP
ncbi:MAG: SMC-Scp complex subunit ScpB, partial [Verrucomicrobiae bacterium]|nr:SMC-Scp complex subunit ScpB [Verrucomicrobiae bacterium]